MKKLVALSLVACMTTAMVGTTVSVSAEEIDTSELSFAFCTNTLNNTFQSSMDAKFSELCEVSGIYFLPSAIAACPADNKVMSLCEAVYQPRCKNRYQQHRRK